jgi:predicted nucleic acid-binding protein
MTDRIQSLVETVLKASPRWITEEIVLETVTLFETRYGRALVPDEVREIIVNVGRFVDVVKRM